MQFLYLSKEGEIWWINNFQNDKQVSWNIAKVRLHTYEFAAKYPNSVVPYVLKQIGQHGTIVR